MPLDKRYKPQNSEPKWQAFWEERGIFRYAPGDDRPTYAVDTPPPTVSGRMHMGHVFSYTQAEALIRFWRLRGFNVFYPFGFDDNGLPTERYVEETRKVKGRDIPRAEFAAMCLEATKEIEAIFKSLWQSLGFSCDWTLEYSTIEPASQRISQRSFLDLLHRELAYRKEQPALWCPECQTAVAQAEEEDVEGQTLFSDIPFAVKEGGQLVIATTRPELLGSCVCVFVHPDDEKNRHLVGKTAIVPIFDREVPILTEADIDMEKGTGIVMCCTFGDTKDVEWWERHELPLAISIDQRGHMTDLAGPYAGMYLKKARKQILADLEARGLILQQSTINHVVNTHDRCGTPVEFLITMQWFIKVLDYKDELLARGEELNWYPHNMKVRYDHWVENLHWDWGVSRQRFFGVPIPVWFCDDCETIITARDEDLPIDPRLSDPPGPCPACGSTKATAETDVLDTWATSSVTPQINGRWGEAEDRMDDIFPMALRPQAHDIIRTWAFYTIVKAHHHHDQLPWRDIVISGHVVDSERKKISKSRLKDGGAAKKTAYEQASGHPEKVIQEYSADPIRYWACRANVGTDTAYDEQMIAQGRRFVTKLWNAARFALMQVEDWDGSPGSPTPIDRAVIAELEALQVRATRALESYELGTAVREIETFFWSTFCDNYLEMVKQRTYDADNHGIESKRAGQATLMRVLHDIVIMLAPFMPHVTEEIYQHGLRGEADPESVHIARWPDGANAAPDEGAAATFAAAVDVITAVRKFKSEQNISMGAPLDRLTIGVGDDARVRLESATAELTSTVRAAAIEFGHGDGGPAAESDNGVSLWIDVAVRSQDG